MELIASIGDGPVALASAIFTYQHLTFTNSHPSSAAIYGPPPAILAASPNSTFSLDGRERHVTVD